MKANQLKPAGTLAQKYGAKCVVYGGPGTGKTPLINTAPRPVLLACEPGLLSMRGSNVPTWQAFTVPLIWEFFEWLGGSSEAKNFDTVGIDSFSQLAEIFLLAELAKQKDPRKAYGNMSKSVMELAYALYFMPQKHMYLITKQAIIEEDGNQKKKPYFPGQDLNVKIPHLYDEILHLSLAIIPGVAQPTKAFRTRESFDIVARDRSGNLDEYEEPNLTKLFNKVML